MDAAFNFVCQAWCAIAMVIVLMEYWMRKPHKLHGYEVALIALLGVGMRCIQLLSHLKE